MINKQLIQNLKLTLSLPEITNISSVLIGTFNSGYQLILQVTLYENALCQLL